MNTLELLDAAALLRQIGLNPSKRLGQNFLQDPVALERIAACAEIQATDSVLEIGAGLGSLTRYLSRSAGTVVAVEVDQRLIPVLHKVIAPFTNVRVVHGDILSLSPADLGLQEDYVVAANIPYNITSAIIRHLLEGEPRPRRIVLTVQQEVGLRICASPPDMSILALSVQLYGNPEMVARVPAQAFFPAPKVDSAVVRIEIYPAPVIAEPLLPTFFKLIRGGFSQKRKTIRNALSSALRVSTATTEELLAAANIDSRRRAETLLLTEWNGLCEQWSSLKTRSG